MASPPSRPARQSSICMPTTPPPAASATTTTSMRRSSKASAPRPMPSSIRRCRSPAPAMPANCAAPRSATSISNGWPRTACWNGRVIDPRLGRLHALRSKSARGEAGYTYFNPDDHFREGMRIAAQYGVRPSYAIYEAGCTRLGAATAAAMPKVPTPVYRFMFARRILLRFPAASRSISMRISRCSPKCRRRRALDGRRPRRRYQAADRAGGGARRPYPRRPGRPALGRAGNQRGLVGEAVRLVRAAGGEPASAAEVRAACMAADVALDAAMLTLRVKHD